MEITKKTTRGELPTVVERNQTGLGHQDGKPHTEAGALHALTQQKALRMSVCRLVTQEQKRAQIRPFLLSIPEGREKKDRAE